MSWAPWLGFARPRPTRTARDVGRRSCGSSSVQAACGRWRGTVRGRSRGHPDHGAPDRRWPARDAARRRGAPGSGLRGGAASGEGQLGEAARRRCAAPARRGSSSTLRCAGPATQFAAALRRAVASSASQLVDAALRRAAARLAAALRRAMAARRPRARAAWTTAPRGWLTLRALRARAVPTTEAGWRRGEGAGGGRGHGPCACGRVAGESHPRGDRHVPRPDHRA
jgi:hypothetical protein